MTSIKKYHIGLTQWGYKDWKENFFTEEATPSDFLRQYASVFNSVEGNTTFYQVPTSDTVINWGKSVDSDFKFCFKFPRTITHDSRLKNVKEETLSFLNIFKSIRNNLGPFHIQLSPQFSYSEIETLQLFFEILPAHFSFALEVRNPDFFDKGRKERHLNDLLKSYGINRVIFDTRKLHSLNSTDPSIRKAKQRKPNNPVRFESTGANPFIRYVGANDIANNEAYLKEWAIMIADWIRSGKHPYIFIHSPDTFYAPSLATFFHNELANLIDLAPMPEWPVHRSNKQLGLF